MTWLSDDPWPLGGTLGMLAVAFLIALRFTQQGKYLIAALTCLALCAMLLIVEHLWVTDAERIEAVVYDLGRAAARSDADAALALMTPDVTFSHGDFTLGGPQSGLARRFLPRVDPAIVNPARALVGTALKNTKFDFVTITRLRANAGRLTRQGTAEFRVFAAGVGEVGGLSGAFATDAGGTDWSLGFREEKGRWMIDRITATRLPYAWSRFGRRIGNPR